MRQMSSGSRCLRLRVILYCGLLHAAVAQAEMIDLTKELPGVQAIALDEANSRLLFFQRQSAAANALWDLMSLKLTPGCKAGTIGCSTTIVASNFSAPQNVTVNAETGIAYVTNADINPHLPPGGSFLIRVEGDILKRVASLASLGNIALAPEQNSAYVSGRKAFCNIGFEPCPFGWIYRVNLETGATVMLAQGPAPFDFVLTRNRERAYVIRSKQLVEIDLSTGKQNRTISSEIDDNTLLAWANATESALYLLERNETIAGLNRIFQIDLTNSQKNLIADNLGAVSSGIAADSSGESLYLSLDSKVVRIPLFTPPTAEFPVFLSVGRVPVTSIDTDGYANSKPGDPLQVVNAPFGGTLDIFGNLPNFLEANAAEYTVEASRDGGPFVPIVTSWITQRWNQTRFQPEVIAPIPGTKGHYAISHHYSNAATIPFWSPPYLMLRWQTSENGKYRLRVRIFKRNGNETGDITYKLEEDYPGKNSLVVQVDNLPPVVDLTEILSSETVVEPCTIVDLPTKNSFTFKLTANDPNGHLLSYSLSALWGRNQSGKILSDSYDASGPRLWAGVEATILPDGTFWPATCNCAHTFVLDAWKRTINGYSYILKGSSLQSVTINNTGNSCDGAPGPL